MRYLLSLGSNSGDRELHLQNALNFLEDICDNVYTSTHYASPALGGGKPYYLNSVATIDFDGDADELNKRLKECEIIEGRDIAAREAGEVPLDIDIVIEGNTILRPRDFEQYFFRRGYEELRDL